MEGREEDYSNGTAIPKKSRSLDLKSLYKSKLTEEITKKKNLKRTGSSHGGGDDKRNKRKKARKEVSLSSLENADGSSKKVLEEECDKGPNSGGGLNRASLSVGGDVCIPKRKRNFVGRKKSDVGQASNLAVRPGCKIGDGDHEPKLGGDDSSRGVESSKRNFVGQKKSDVGQASNLAGCPACKIGDGDHEPKLGGDDSSRGVESSKRNFMGRKKSDVGQASNLAGHPSCRIGDSDREPKLGGDDLSRGAESSKIKQKKYFDEIKENRSSDSNSVQNFKENGDRASHSVVNSGDTSLTKPRRKDRKRKALASDRIRVSKEAEPLIDSCKISDELQEDDEENLEENAARMLSSRFDPSCTGFSSSSKSSPLPSSNGLSFLLSSSRNIVNRRSKSRSGSGSESASVDTAGRILRPRKQDRDKGNSRKRRHYYEIPLGDVVDAYWMLNRRIKVFWPLDQSWYYGFVYDYDKDKRLHHIKYDDRDEEWINLQTERFKLLLLRSEVPGNVKGGRTSAKSRSSDKLNGSKSRKERRRREVITKDDSCGGSSMDSEPIISWLARSSHRLKSSFHGNKKQKISDTFPSTNSSLLYDEPVTVKGHTAKSSLRGVKNNLSSDSVSQDKLGDNFREKSSLQSAPHTKEGKQPIVYYRKRFRRPAPISPRVPEEKHDLVSAPCSISFDNVVGGVENVKEPSDRWVEVEGPLWFIYKEGLPKIFWDLESASLKFDLNFPIRLVLNEAFQSENLRLLCAGLMLWYGTLMTKWPRVYLEMLFVDNVVGLRFLLFEGCLKMAAAFVSFVLRLFHQPAHRGKDELQLPFTSIIFKFSSVHVIKKPIVFALYNFSRVKNSKWLYLDSKLKTHCLLSKQLHLSECTYDNIQALQNGSSGFVVTSINEPSSIKVMRRRSRPGINIMGVSKVSTQIDTHMSSDAANRKLPPFALSFTAAPTYFLCLHLKLLMEQSAAHISFCNHAPKDDQEDSCLVTDDCSSIDDRNSEIILRKDMMNLSNYAAGYGGTCVELGHVIGSSTPSDQVLSQKYQNIGLNDAGTSISHGSERLRTIHSSELQSHHSALELGSLPSSSSRHQDKADDGSHSFMDDLNVQIPSVDEFEKPSAQNSPDCSWNINGGVIPSPNPTAPRSSWHRSRNSSLSLGSQSHGWSDGKADSLYNDFSNGPKKPRTQVSYSVPFQGYEFSSRHRNHHQKGLPHKRIRKASEKKSSDVARVPEKNFECVYCDANVLITLVDKGWRESGAHVVLELFDHNEWKLSVKLLGVTRYSYKAHQFMQPGSTNRFTHAMMWKGGKDWILEFPERSQWALFKEMHEECYNRNIRAASVKNIPIPGVHFIEENDDNGSEVNFVRSCKYFRQVETDVEMALDPSRVLYDMDSEDEQWISNIRNSGKFDGDLNGITEDMFEKTMDMFEKAAYAQLRDKFTLDEIEELLVNVGPLRIVKIIYDHWQQRRQKKGMALIRHFQPPLWELYQQQAKKWEAAVTKNNYFSSIGSPGMVAMVEKPTMFAFCLKPRGLESLNKGFRQRSQKKISVSGHTNNIPDQDGFHTFGRRLNGVAFGDEKFVYPGHSYDSLDDSPLPQTSPRIFSSRDASSMGYYSMSNDGYYRNHIPKFHRSKSKKSGSFMYRQRVSVSERRNGVAKWYDYDLPGHRRHQLDGAQRLGIEQLDALNQDEFKLLDASGAAMHSRNMAKLKRERAQRLIYRADLAIHKAVVALMTAEAMKDSEDSVSDGGATNI